MKPMTQLLLLSAMDRLTEASMDELEYFAFELAKREPATAERLKNAIAVAQQEIDNVFIKESV
jgi:hypothetical protein